MKNVVNVGDLASLEARFLETLKTDRARDSFKPHVVLCGSHLLGTHLRRQAARTGTALLNVRFYTFDTIAAELLPLDYRRKKLISPLGELALLRKILRSEPGYFAPVQDKRGFWFALLGAVQDLIDGGVEAIPDSVQKTQKLQDVARIFGSYRGAIAPFISRSHALQLATENVDQFAATFGTESLAVYGFYDFTFLQESFLRAAAERLSLNVFLPYRSDGAYGFSEQTLAFFKQTGFEQKTNISPEGNPTSDLGRLQARIFQPVASVKAEEVSVQTGDPASLRGAGGAERTERKKMKLPHPAQRGLFDKEVDADGRELGISPAPEPPALATRNLKLETRHPLPDGAVKIISTADEAGEITEICREIQSCAQQGIDFSEMAVLLRNPEVYVPLIVDIFKGNGIPYYLQSGIPLAETHPAKSLLLFLELLETDFPRSRVMEFAAFAPLRWKALLPGAEESPERAKFRISPAAWDRLSARAGVGSGLENWLKRLTGLSQDLEKKLGEKTTIYEDPDSSAHSDFHLQMELFQTKTLLEFIRSLDRWKNLFAKCKTWNSFASLTRQMMEICFTDPNVETPRRGVSTTQDAFLQTRHVASPGSRNATPTAAADGIWQQLKDIVDLIATLDQVDPDTDLEGWISALNATLENDRMSVARFQDGRVSVLGVMGGRGVRHRVVFVPGMTERGFPVTARQDAILLDKERREINQATGGGLPQKLLRLYEEQLLFHLCLGAAVEKLVLSFPRMDIQTGRSRLPSHYLVRVGEALTGSSHDYQSMERLPHLKRIPLSQLGPKDPFQALTENQFALAFLGDTRRVPASLYKSRLSRALEAYRARWSRNFTHYDGFIQSADSLASIAQWAGQQFFSPSRLEIFATCPYRFFLLKLLRLEAIQKPETIQKISPLDKGDLIHKILDDFMRAAKDQGWFPLRPERARQLRELLDQVAQRFFRQAEDKGITGYRLLWELDAEQILADLHTFVQREAEKGDRFIPDRFEVEFGKKPDSPFQLALSDGTCLNLTGRIDRIDVNPAGTGLRVVDYKTGKSHIDEATMFEGGKRLQLPLYLLAAAKMYGLSNLEESLAEYYFVSSAGKFQVHPFTGEQWKEKEEDLMQLLAIINTAIRQGKFPATPGKDQQHCTWCDFRLVCDKAVDRIHFFKSKGPELEFQRLLEGY